MHVNILQLVAGTGPLQSVRERAFWRDVEAARISQERRASLARTNTSPSSTTSPSKSRRTSPHRGGCVGCAGCCGRTDSRATSRQTSYASLASQAASSTDSDSIASLLHLYDSGGIDAETYMTDPSVARPKPPARNNTELMFPPELDGYKSRVTGTGRFAFGVDTDPDFILKMIDYEFHAPGAFCFYHPNGPLGEHPLWEAYHAAVARKAERIAAGIPAPPSQRNILGWETQPDEVKARDFATASKASSVAAPSQDQSRAQNQPQEIMKFGASDDTCAAMVCKSNVDTLTAANTTANTITTSKDCVVVHGFGKFGSNAPAPTNGSKTAGFKSHVPPGAQHGVQAALKAKVEPRQTFMEKSIACPAPLYEGKGKNAVVADTPALHPARFVPQDLIKTAAQRLVRYDSVCDTKDDKQRSASAVIRPRKSCLKTSRPSINRRSVAIVDEHAAESAIQSETEDETDSDGDKEDSFDSAISTGFAGFSFKSAARTATPDTATPDTATSPSARNTPRKSVKISPDVIVYSIDLDGDAISPKDSRSKAALQPAENDRMSAAASLSLIASREPVKKQQQRSRGHTRAKSSPSLLSSAFATADCFDRLRSTRLRSASDMAMPGAPAPTCTKTIVAPKKGVHVRAPGVSGVKKTGVKGMNGRLAC